MPAEIVEKWLGTGKSACLAGRSLRPLAHPALPGTPLAVQRGQAEAFILTDSAGGRWVLKKFHQGRALEPGYLRSVGSLLPDHESFTAGTERHVLSASDVGRGQGSYGPAELAGWIDGTILMPRVPGMDWASIADDLRDGSLKLDSPQRLAIVSALASCIHCLEDGGIAHRDLSSGNVFIDLVTGQIWLIDFDSLYHPSLRMPRATTCGTVGYTAPYAWRREAPDARATWCGTADRYALALLITEILVLQQGGPLSAEGGIFDQEDLRKRTGPSITFAQGVLKSQWPEHFSLFSAAIDSKGFEDCPTPSTWARASQGCEYEAPTLAEWETAGEDDFEDILGRRRPAAPLWPAPSLAELPDVEIELPARPVALVTLPEDPWETVQ